MHYFSQKQPDLNWENPKVRQEVYDIMKFWAKKGVDGFRLDAFQFAAKDTTFPAFPAGFEKNFIDYYAMQGNLHTYLQEMHREVFSKYNVMSVAEGEDMDLYLKKLKFSSRDNGRTPMQWQAADNAGFTTGVPWLPVNNNAKIINVEAENADAGSCLNYFRSLVKIRKNNKVLIHGAYQLVQPEHPQIYAYTRSLEKDKALVLLNFSAENATIELPATLKIKDTLIINYSATKVQGARQVLKPYQAIIYTLY